MSTIYKVISQHGASARTRSRTFASADKARAYAETISPEVDGSTVPNVAGPMIAKAEKDETYYQGLFWLGNRYAVIITPERSWRS